MDGEKCDRFGDESDAAPLCEWRERRHWGSAPHAREKGRGVALSCDTEQWNPVVFCEGDFESCCIEPSDGSGHCIDNSVRGYV